MELCRGCDLTGIVAQASVPWVSIFMAKMCSLNLKRLMSKKRVKIAVKSGKCHRSR